MPETVITNPETPTATEIMQAVHRYRKPQTAGAETAKALAVAQINGTGAVRAWVEIMQVHDVDLQQDSRH